MKVAEATAVTATDPLPVADAVPVAPMPVATAVPVAPVTATYASSDLMATVPELARARKMVMAGQAEAYCAALPPQPASEYAGFRWIFCYSGDKADIPCGVTYGCNPCGECLMFPLTCCIFPPFINPLVCVCSGERQGNQWITRGKHGEKTGAWVIVDAERKTLQSFGVKCCSTQLEEKPQCLCEKS